MSKTEYTEEEINWALEELRKKGVNNATREHAINLLNTFRDFEKVVVEKIENDKKSGKLKKKVTN